jgi:hypothetical protein
MASPFSWLWDFGRSSSTTNLSTKVATHPVCSQANATLVATPMPSYSSTPINTTLSLQRNLNQLTNEGQREALKNKRDLINNVDRLSTLTFLNSSAGINVQHIQDQFEQIDRTLQTTAMTNRDTKDDNSLVHYVDGKQSSNLHDFLKHEREATLLSMLRMIEDQVTRRTFPLDCIRSYVFHDRVCFSSIVDLR